MLFCLRSRGSARLRARSIQSHGLHAGCDPRAGVEGTLAEDGLSKMSPQSTLWIVAKRALTFALLGAIVGNITGWLMYGEWGIVMAPAFTLIGAIMGVLNAFLISAFIALRNLTVNRPRLALTPEGEMNDAEWANAGNWIGALIYHSRVDRRIIVPKRVSRFGYTINLGRPIGLAIAMVLVAVILGIIITSAFGH